MRKFISILTLTFILLTFITEEAKSSNFTIATYISKYRLIAQLESHRSGIPASIILAQAILESGYGNSDLCQRSKNHFGIKWKNAKDGDFVYSLDDDYDKDGKHIPSRFINYGNDLQSFHHHTDFLLSKDHYKPLFRLDRSDYINWAYGLRACGYSTDKTYGIQLIVLIKRYALNNFDLPTSFSTKSCKRDEDTKMVIKIFSGKNLNWSLFLKTQSSVMEEANMAIANEPKIEQDTRKYKYMNFPLLPFNSTRKRMAFNTSAFLRTRFEIS